MSNSKVKKHALTNLSLDDIENRLSSVRDTYYSQLAKENKGQSCRLSSKFYKKLFTSYSKLYKRKKGVIA